MDFLRRRKVILAVIACLAVLAAVTWFCLSGSGRQTMPEGTLVERQTETAEVSL